MSFQVTRCPSCASTFNTNPKLLDMAEGRVRCGACLTVFDAVEHFISTNQGDQEQSEESVFIGSDPEDFFDPSVFLTRSALSQTDDEIEFTEQADETERSTHGEFADFIDTEEIQSEDLFTREPAQREPEFTEPQFDLEHPHSPTENDFESEARELQAESKPPISADTTTLSFKSALEEAPEESLPARTEAAQQQEHQEFFAAVDESLAGLIKSDEISDLEEIAQLDVPAPAHDELLAITKETKQSVEDKNNHPQIDQTDSALANTAPPVVSTPHALVDELTKLSGDKSKRPEDISFSVSFSFQTPFSNSPAVPDKDLPPSPTVAQAELESTPVIDQAFDDDLKRLVKQAIDEQELTTAIEAGLSEFPELSTEIGETAEEQAESVREISDLAADTPRNSDVNPAEPAQEEAQRVDLDTSTEAIRARVLKAELRDEEALEQIPKEHLNALDQMATPVELVAGISRSWGRRIGLLLIILLFSATLVAQYAWYNQDRFSVDARYRNVFSFVCEQLACELPDYSEIAAIQSDNLTVRSHPNREDGLMVTVEIRNTANFEQRFPILILSFNNSNNDTIALREFAPEEYLDPGLREFEFMPVISPVQITIPIIDPGPDAVNYTLAFRSP